MQRTLLTADAREPRAAPAEALEPLYAARLGNIPRCEAVERAIKRSSISTRRWHPTLRSVRVSRANP